MVPTAERIVEQPFTFLRSSRAAAHRTAASLDTSQGAMENCAAAAAARAGTA